MRKLFFLPLLLSTIVFGQPRGLWKRPVIEWWLPFNKTQQPIDNPLIAYTGQYFNTIQNGSQLLAADNLIQKTGSGFNYGQNTLRSQASVIRKLGYTVGVLIYPTTTGNSIFGFETTTPGVGENAFNVASSAGVPYMAGVEGYSTVYPIGYSIVAGQPYYCFLILRNNGAFYVVRDLTSYYLIDVNSTHSNASLKIYLDFYGGNTLIDWMRAGPIPSISNEWFFDTSAITTVMEGSTFTHNANGWIVFKITTQSTGGAEIRFRVQDANNYLKLVFNADRTATLSKVVAGVVTVLASNFGSFSNGTENKIFLNGSAIAVFDAETTALVANVTESSFVSSSGGVIQSLGGGTLAYVHLMPFDVTGFDLTGLDALFSPSEPSASDFVASTIYASPTGNGIGTTSDPYSIATALGKLAPGVTLILKAGTYNNCDLVVNISGTQDYPIVIKPETGALVKVDVLNNLAINGADVQLDGTGGWLEFYSDSWTGDRFVGPNISSVFIDGARNVIKNCIFHDFGNVGFWGPSINSTFWGNLIYSIGYGNSSQGHCLYTQNNSGTKTISHNILYGGNYISSFALHHYGTGAAGLKGYNYQKNIVGAGTALIGAAGTKIADTTFSNNVILAGGFNLGLLGVPYDPPHELTGDGNKLYDTGINVKTAGVLDWTNNRLVNSIRVDPTYVGVASGNVNYNTYTFANQGIIYNPDNFNWNFNFGSLATVKTHIPFEQNSSTNIYSGLPLDDYVVDVYESDRATVAIANFSLSSTVNVSLTGLTNGVTYTAYNSLNTAEGFDFMYNGTNVTFPMTGWTAAQPIATLGGAMTTYYPGFPINLFPKFGIFYIVKKLI